MSKQNCEVEESRDEGEISEEDEQHQNEDIDSLLQHKQKLLSLLEQADSDQELDDVGLALPPPPPPPNLTGCTQPVASVNDLSAPVAQLKRSLFGLDASQSQVLSPLKRARVATAGSDDLTKTPPSASLNLFDSEAVGISDDSEDDLISVKSNDAPEADTSNAQLPSANDIKDTPPQLSTATEDVMVQHQQVDVDDVEEDSDFSDVDVDQLLEQPFANGTAPVSAPVQPKSVREKFVLKNRHPEYFEVLPDGWIELTHKSGLPVYLHKSSRVCCFSRPYYLGRASAQAHTVPVSAIPCLHQQQMDKKHADVPSANCDKPTDRTGTNGQNDVAASSTAAVNGNADLTATTAPTDKKAAEINEKLGAPAVMVQTVEDYVRRNLRPEQLREYAQRRFEFETLQVVRFQRWRHSRQYHQRTKQQRHNNAVQLEGDVSMCSAQSSLNHSDAAGISRPTLPANTKLITVPAMDIGIKPTHRPFVLNPQGKTSVAILHEYVQKVLRVLIKYECTETRNSAQPYQVTVKLQSKPNDPRGNFNRIRLPGNVRELIARLRREQGYDKEQQDKPSTSTKPNSDHETAAADSASKTTNNVPHTPDDSVNGKFTTDGELSSTPSKRGATSPRAGRRSPRWGRGRGRGRGGRGGSPRRFNNNNNFHQMSKSEQDAACEWIALGVGYGASKKNAKLDSAKAALEVLVPGIEFNDDYLAESSDAPRDDDVVALFNLLALSDSRVPEMSVKAGQPSPFIILQECLKRHSAFGDTTVTCNVRKLAKPGQHEFTMTVGKHVVKVHCINKRDGKQKASQAMLGKLHPQLSTWGSLIRMYGYGAQMKSKETQKKREEVIKLQAQNISARNRDFNAGAQTDSSPTANQTILDKLHSEMDLMFEKRASQQTADNVNGARVDNTSMKCPVQLKNFDL